MGVMDSINTSPSLPITNSFIYSLGKELRNYILNHS